MAFRTPDIGRRFSAWLRLMQREPSRYAALAARLLLFVAAFVPVVFFGYFAWRTAYVTYNRMHCFYELEPYEGDMTLHAIRVLEGKQLYPDRKGNYIPLLYPPMFSYLNAIAMKIVDDPDQPHTLYAGRLVSICSALGIMLIILVWVYRETRHLVAAVCASLYFAGISPFIAFWFDLVRVDTAHVFFVALGTFAFMDRRSNRAWAEAAKGILAGLAFTLGFYTKQTAGQIALPMTFIALMISPVRGVWGMSSGATFGGLLFLYLTATNPDFFYLCVEVPSHHGVHWDNWKGILFQHLLNPAAVPLMIILGWTGLTLVRRQWRLALCMPVLCMVCYLCLRGHKTIGGYVNHYTTAWFFISVFMGIAVGSFIPRAAGARRPVWQLAPAAAVILAAVLLSFEWSVKQPANITADRVLPLYFGLAGLVFLAGFMFRPLAPGVRVRMRHTARGVLPLALLFLTALELGHYANVYRIYKPENPGATAPAADPRSLTEKLRAMHDRDRNSILARYIPSDQAIFQSRRMLEGIRNIDGTLWFANNSYYSYIVGREPEISLLHVRDLVVSGRAQGSAEYALRTIREKRYKYIIVNNRDVRHDWLEGQTVAAIQTHYQLYEDWDRRFGPLAMKPVDSTGWKPRGLYIRTDQMKTAAPR